MIRSKQLWLKRWDYGTYKWQLLKSLNSQRKQEKLEEIEASKKKPEKFVPNRDYKDKFAHLIGQDVALEAARKTQTNKSYGFGKYILKLKSKNISVS